MHRSQTGLKRKGRNREIRPNDKVAKENKNKTINIQSDGEKACTQKYNTIKGVKKSTTDESSNEHLDVGDKKHKKDLRKRNRVVRETLKNLDETCEETEHSCNNQNMCLSEVEHPVSVSTHKRQKHKSEIKNKEKTHQMGSKQNATGGKTLKTSLAVEMATPTQTTESITQKKHIANDEKVQILRNKEKHVCNTKSLNKSKSNRNLGKNDKNTTKPETDTPSITTQAGQDSTMRGKNSQYVAEFSQCSSAVNKSKPESETKSDSHLQMPEAKAHYQLHINKTTSPAKAKQQVITICKEDVNQTDKTESLPTSSSHKNKVDSESNGIDGPGIPNLISSQKNVSINKKQKKMLHMSKRHVTKNTGGDLLTVKKKSSTSDYKAQLESASSTKTHIFLTPSETKDSLDRKNICVKKQIIKTSQQKYAKKKQENNAISPSHSTNYILKEETEETKMTSRETSSSISSSSSSSISSSDEETVKNHKVQEETSCSDDNSSEGEADSLAIQSEVEGSNTSFNHIGDKEKMSMEENDVNESSCEKSESETSVDRKKNHKKKNTKKKQLEHLEHDNEDENKDVIIGITKTEKKEKKQQQEITDIKEHNVKSDTNKTKQICSANVQECTSSNSESEEKGGIVQVKEVPFSKRKSLPRSVKTRLLHSTFGTTSKSGELTPKQNERFIRLIKNTSQVEAEVERPTIGEIVASEGKTGQRLSTYLKAEVDNIEVLEQTAQPCFHLIAQTSIITALRKREKEAREKLHNNEKKCHQNTSGNAKTNEMYCLDDQMIKAETTKNITTVKSSPASNNRLLIRVQGKSGMEEHKIRQLTSKVKQKKYQDALQSFKTKEMKDSNKDSKRMPKYSKNVETASLSTFHRVTGWIKRGSPKKFNLKKRLARVARAIGITDWLFRTFRRKNKYNSRGLKRVTNMRFLSSCKFINQISADPKRRKSKQVSGVVCKLKHDSKESGTTLPPSSVDNGCETPKAEESTGTPDAKYAIVFPRINHLAKQKNISPTVTSSNVVVSAQPASSTDGTEIVMKDTKKNIHNHPETMKYQYTQLTKSRSSVAHSLQSESQISVAFSKHSVTKENQEQGDNVSKSVQVDGLEISDSQLSLADMDDTQETEEKEGQNLFYGTRGNVHWAQSVCSSSSPTDWLRSEVLLPRLTVENLSKWSIYKETPSTKMTQPLKYRWEAEDSTEDLLQMAMNKTQAQTLEEWPEVEELTDLSFLGEICESTILLCLKKRFHQDNIYTSIGHLLLSVNPFKSLNIYSLETAQIYQDDKAIKRQPHIFAVAEEAYILSSSCEHPPNILLSGHSGSGKSVAVKMISQYLAASQRTQGGRNLKLLDFLVVLESFGKAKTVLNNTSSRFGQILQVYLQRGVVVGYSISYHLLEKSRVVFQAHGERGFHVFYELLRGLPETEKQFLYLQEPEMYFYLNQGRACDLPGKDDIMDFQQLERCLGRLGLSSFQQNTVWTILSAILQLGNVCFTSLIKVALCKTMAAVVNLRVQDSYESTEAFRTTEIRIVASLLQISPEGIQRAMTQRIIFTSYECVCCPLSVEAAVEIRDAIAQSLYAVLFDWLLEKGNDWLKPRETDHSLGIIDICGFENLDVNSLDQLCRNFANEHIICYSKKRLLSQEQAEYSSEGISWIPLCLEEGNLCLGLLSDRPHGIFHILEEQTQLAQPMFCSDRIYKIAKQLKENNKKQVITSGYASIYAGSNVHTCS